MTETGSSYLERLTSLLEPVPEVAKALGCTRQYVLQLINDERLEAVRLGRDYFVSALSLQEYIEARTRRRQRRSLKPPLPPKKS